MQARFEMTDGLSTLQAILKERPQDSPYWNEAQNRFQFIDRLLTECLGWQKPDISVENIEGDQSRADYVLGKRKAILEAKRETVRFSVPPQHSKTRLRKLKPLLKSSNEFSEAVTQVLPYCAMRGAPIGIVCNGPQLAIFQAIVIGEEPLEGECYFFDGFASYVQDFPLLWALLSPEGIAENRAFHELAKHRSPRMPPKASQSIAEPLRFRYRTALQEELRNLASMLLEDIETDPAVKEKFYEECYVPLEANNRNLLLSKQVIEGRYRRAPLDATNVHSLDALSRTGRLSDQALAGAGSKPIVVLGDVGVGKSSFFENLIIKVRKSDPKTIYIKVDLGTRANLADGLKSFVLSEIPDVLRDQYAIDIFESSFVRTIYHDEIVRFDKTIEGESKKTDPNAYNAAQRKFLQSKIDRSDTHMKIALSHSGQCRPTHLRRAAGGLPHCAGTSGNSLT